MNLIDQARKAFDLVQQGRAALEAIASSVKDGTAAVNATEQAELNEMLERERLETKQAHDNLQNAINASRAQAR